MMQNRKLIKRLWAVVAIIMIVGMVFFTVMPAFQ